MDVFKLIVSVFIPGLAAFLLSYMEKKTELKNWNRWAKQFFFGAIFGLIEVLVTHLGIKIPDTFSVICVRNATVVLASLVFGPTAGIVAGFLGVLERFFAILPVGESYERFQFLFSMAIFVLFSSGIKKFIYEKQIPNFFASTVISICTSVLHMLVIFVAYMTDSLETYEIIRKVALPSIALNAACVAIGIIAVSFCKEVSKLSFFKRGITNTFQNGLFICLFFAFAFTNSFTIYCEHAMARSDTEKEISVNIDDIIFQIDKVSKAKVLSIVKNIAKRMETTGLQKITNEHLEEFAKLENIHEVHVVDRNGTIIKSNKPDMIGFDMASNEKSAKFLCLLDDQTEYVNDFLLSKRSNSWKIHGGVRLSDGTFVEIALTDEVYHSNLSFAILNTVVNRHIGSSGSAFIVSTEKIIEVGREGYDGKTLDEVGLGNILEKKEGELFECSIKKATNLVEGEDNTVECYGMYKQDKGHYVVGLIARSSALIFGNISSYIISFMEVIIFCVLFFIMFFLLEKFVIQDVKKINASLEKITNGNLDEHVDVRNTDEFASISDGINKTVTALKGYITSAEEKSRQDMENAKIIQTSSLPTEFYPDRSEFEIYAKMETAKEVGGDFYDFYTVNDNKLYFLIADVSGKGIPAAMFMMKAKTILKSLALTGISVEEVFTKANNILYEKNEAEMFVTSWIGSLDLETGKVEFANAGHNPPLIRHCGTKGYGKDDTKDNRNFEFIKSKPSFVLAGINNIDYKKYDFQMEKGDVLFLYTDGVTEAMDSGKNLYGENRMLSLLNSIETSSPMEICDRVKSDVDSFVGNAPQFDDMTMLAIKFKGKNIKTYSFEKASISDIEGLTEKIDEELEKIDFPMKSRIQIDVAIDELFSNIANYAYKRGSKNESGPATVIFEEVNNPHGITLKFIDSGIPYNPLNHSDPDTTLTAEEREIGGLGIFMVKKTMDDLLYEFRDDKNIFTIRKNFE